MNAAHLNRRIQMLRESNEAHHYLLCSPRILIETWALECVFYKKYSRCCDTPKVRLKHWERRPYLPKHYNSVWWTGNIYSIVTVLGDLAPGDSHPSYMTVYTIDGGYRLYRVV